LWIDILFFQASTFAQLWVSLAQTRVAGWRVIYIFALLAIAGDRAAAQIAGDKPFVGEDVRSVFTFTPSTVQCLLRAMPKLL
jgi:hypothetical protein